MDNPVRQIGVTSHLVVEANISRYDRILRLNRQREVEAVIDRVVEVDRQPCGGSSKLRHWDGKRDRHSLQCIHRVSQITRRDIAAPSHGP